MKKSTLFGLLALAAATVASIRQSFDGQCGNVVLGLATIVLSIRLDPVAKRRMRFGWMALVALTLAVWLRLPTLKYLSVLFAGLFWIERRAGRVNALPVWAALLTLPVLSNFAEVFSFPIRLSLSSAAGRVLSAGVYGDTIDYNGSAFLVDPACMGLQMLIASGFGGLLLVGLNQKKYCRELRTGALLVVGVLAIACNVLSNLLRIVLLVFFHVLPGNLHETIGLLCFALYGMAPLVPLTAWMVRRFGREIPPTVEKRDRRRPFLEWSLLFTVAVTLFLPRPDDAVRPISNVIPAGFQRKLLADGIVQLSAPGTFWYIKPIKGCLYAEHNPLICWTGCGYELRDVKETNGIYTAELDKGPERLYTAWWYDNGRRHTTSQLAWRWDAATGAPPYALVNVTASTPESLERNVAGCMRLRPRVFGLMHD